MKVMGKNSSMDAATEVNTSARQYYYFGFYYYGGRPMTGGYKA